MTRQDMIDLLYVYDGFCDLEQVMSILSGSDQVYMYNEGAVGKISRVLRVIARHSPTYDASKEFDETEFASIIDCCDLSIEKKADKLLLNNEGSDI